MENHPDINIIFFFFFFSFCIFFFSLVRFVSCVFLMSSLFLYTHTHIFNVNLAFTYRVRNSQSHQKKILGEKKKKREGLQLLQRIYSFLDVSAFCCLILSFAFLVYRLRILHLFRCHKLLQNLINLKFFFSPLT